jgi:predicted AlkP superfamily phosphohydrolase/phosphomutase
MSTAAVPDLTAEPCTCHRVHSPAVSTDLSGKAVVLGLDGATWDLLRPLAERGVMPNLARALELGRHGRLESCLPPFSSPAWVSISTGKNPGSHGIFDFWEAGAPGERRLVSSRSARGRKLWELASDAGKVVHVVAVPVSYPPARVNGSFVCGMFTPGESVDYTWPPELKAELKALPGGYEADPYARGLAGRAFLEQTHDVIRRQEVATRHLLAKGEWDLLFTVIQAPDPVQHKFWNVLDSSDPRYDEAAAREHLPLLEETYRLCDEVIGDRMAMAERGATVMVISDHGFGRYEKLFNLNRVLEDAGLLVRRRSAVQVAPKGLSTRQVIRALRRLDVLGIERRLPGQLRQRLAGRIDAALSAPIDMQHTLAYAAASSAESVFLGPSVGEHQRAGVAQRVIGALEAARDPDTGERIVERAYRREDLYQGAELHRIPDILIDFGERPYLASDRLAAASIVETIPPAAGGGRHRRYGVLLALGPGVAPGGVDGARIVDIAPTALHAMGLPVPDDMDGRVLTELFADGRAVQRSSATDSGTGEVVYTDEEAAAIEKSLENLGYI